jgi:23S rRNA pseudouridine1911/1915/1917 synthase
MNEQIKIIAETPDYLVLNKPAGILVHPTQANETDTLADWLKENYPKIKKVGDAPERPGIVHRLDREASGLLVVAKNQKMFDVLKKQFQEREIEKEYLVLVYEKILADEGEIDFEIDRGREGRMVSRPRIDKTLLKNVDKDQPGKESLTEFWVEKRYARFTLLRVRIHTGRMHQIRVHMFAYNHPVVGDQLYLNRKLIKKNEQKIDRLFLHSAKLCFNDLKGEKKCFESELPLELKEYLKKLN